MEGALREPGGLFADVDKTVAVIRVTLASRFAYLGEMLVRTIFLLLILFTFAQLWRATQASQNVSLLTGFTIAQLIWYLAFTEAIMMSAPAFTELEVDREVRTGDIAYRLARPLSYPLYHLGLSLGDRLLRFVLNLTVGCAVAAVLVGSISLSPASVVAGLLAALVAFLVDWAWTFAISLLAFWLEDTTGIHLLYRRCVMLLGGMLLPLEAYPSWLERVARALPFQYIMYQPGRLFVAPEATNLAPVLLGQGFLLAGGIAVMLAIYRLVQSRLSAQGG